MHLLFQVSSVQWTRESFLAVSFQNCLNTLVASRTDLLILVACSGAVHKQSTSRCVNVRTAYHGANKVLHLLDFKMA